MDYKTMFDGLTVEEINARLNEVRAAATAAKKEIRDTLKAEVKVVKEARKADATAKAKDFLKNAEEGSIVEAIFKGEVVEVEFVKNNEKTFTAMVNGVKKAIAYDKLVLAADEAEVAV